MIAWILASLAGASQLNGCDSVYSYPGTASWQVAMDARESTSQLFGAAGFAEDVLFPSLVEARKSGEKGQPHFAGGVRMMEMFQTVSVPSLERAWTCPYGATMRDMDMYASAFGGGIGVGPATFYMSTGATAMVSWNQTYLRNAGAVSMPMVMAMIGTVSPLWIAVDDPVIWQNDPQGIFADFILGAQLDGGVAGVASLGWSGTQGPYANYTHPKAHFTGAAALSGDFKRLPYGLIGLRELPLDRNHKAGKLSVFGRQLGYTTGVGGEALQFDVRSAHLEQIEIAGILDVRVALNIAPDVRLGEARLGIGKTTELDDGARSSAKLVAGVYDQPDFWFWAVDGGPRPTVSGMAGLYGPGFNFEFIGGWNEPSMLRLYPYAADSLSFQVRVGYGGGGLQ